MERTLSVRSGRLPRAKPAGLKPKWGSGSGQRRKRRRRLYNLKDLSGSHSTAPTFTARYESHPRIDRSTWPSPGAFRDVLRLDTCFKHSLPSRSHICVRLLRFCNHGYGLMPPPGFALARQTGLRNCLLMSHQLPKRIRRCPLGPFCRMKVC